MTSPIDRPAGRHPELRDRVAVVTGAARGIGFGVTARLLAEGMHVVAADIDTKNLDSAVGELEQIVGSRSDGAGGSIRGFSGDLSIAENIERLFEANTTEIGPPYLLVNNAADLRRRRVLDEHSELLTTQIATNLTGPYVCSQQAAAAMAEAGSGVIVNVSSVGATRAHHRGLPYDVTKGAIDAMTRAMAVDLGPLGIRVNAVAPGVTTTRRPKTDSADERAARVVGKIPLRRSGTVADMAGAVAFLASEDASYITGQVLVVDGGITAQLSPGGPDEL